VGCGCRGVTRQRVDGDGPLGWAAGREPGTRGAADDSDRWPSWTAMVDNDCSVADAIKGDAALWLDPDEALADKEQARGGEWVGMAVTHFARADHSIPVLHAVDIRVMAETR